MFNRYKKVELGLLLFFVELMLFLLLAVALDFSMTSVMTLSSLYFFILIFMGHYAFSPILIWQEIINMVKAHFLFIGISLIISFTMPLIIMIKITAITMVMFVGCVIFNRAIRRMFKKRYATKVLVFDASEKADAILDVFVNNGFLFIDVLGYVDISEINHRPLSSIDHIRKSSFPLSEIKHFLKNHHVDQVLVVDDELTTEQFEKIADIIQDKIPVIKYKPKATIIQPYNTKVEDYDGNLFVSVTNSKKRYLESTLKKGLDFFIGVCGCLLLIPITLFIKIAYLCNGDKDPIYFKQNRVGLNGKIIGVYKFRSMIPNAEQVLEELMEKDEKIKEEYLTNKKLENDPRITKIGHFIRKTSLDETPQFINLLKGEMSLIGPRPYLPREIEDMGSHYKIIIKSKPGITGMWQANGRSAVGFEDRCKLDVYYYDNWSLWLDFIIVIKTIKSVVGKEGAM